MRRIFYLITELEIGGAEKALYELATRLDRRKFEPIVACLSGRGPLFGRLKEKGIEVIPIDMCGWWDLAAWVRLRRALRANRPHVLHTFLFHANFVGSLAAIRSGIGTRIASIRVEEPRLRHLWFEWLTQGLTDVFTCVSESARQYTHARAHVPMHKLVVIPNGVDPSDCDAPVLAPPPEWRLPEGAPVVAFVGRLGPAEEPALASARCGASRARGPGNGLRLRRNGAAGGAAAGRKPTGWASPAAYAGWDGCPILGRFLRGWTSSRCHRPGKACPM